MQNFLISDHLLPPSGLHPSPQYLYPLCGIQLGLRETNKIVVHWCPDVSVVAILMMSTLPQEPQKAVEERDELRSGSDDSTSLHGRKPGSRSLVAVPGPLEKPLSKQLLHEDSSWDSPLCACFHSPFSGEWQASKVSSQHVVISKVSFSPTPTHHTHMGNSDVSSKIGFSSKLQH